MGPGAKEFLHQVDSGDSLKHSFLYRSLCELGRNQQAIQAITVITVTVHLMLAKKLNARQPQSAGEENWTAISIAVQ
jgi:hypothetical protein